MFRLAVLSLGLLFCAGAMSLAAPPPAPPKVPKELLEARLKASRDAYQYKEKRLRRGVGAPIELSDWSRRWLDAQLALREKKADRIAAYQSHLERATEIERVARNEAESGQRRPDDAIAAAYYRIDAEIMLIEAGGQIPKLDKPTAPKDREKLGTPQEDK